jgi:tetratricopeptide (TPR) repeat protein
MNIVPVLSVIISVLIMGFLYLVNEIVISIRFNNLKIYLQDLDRNEGDIDHIALIATYEIHKKIYEERITQDTADSIEQKITILSMAMKTDTGPYHVKFGILAYPAVGIINFNRGILGKQPLSFEINDIDDLKELDQAYYYERNFLFRRAIALYDKALAYKKLSDTLKAGILLRQGYCYALAGFPDKALYNYKTVITDYSQESSAITASVLLKYLEGFRDAREKILFDKSDPLLKGQKLVNLLAYQEALDVIDTAEKNADPKELPRIKYFKARCYTGLGQHGKALENYFDAVTSNPYSPYAKYSNRKLFLLGTLAGGRNKILEISKQINKKLNDPVLSKMIEEQAEMSLNGVTVKDAINPDLPEIVKSKVENFIVNKPYEAGASLTVVTGDGNTFIGRLIEENREYISLQTSIGRVDIKKSEIIKVTEEK